MLREITGVLLLTSSLAAQAQNKTEVQWLGQSAFKITSPSGKVIVVDPWLTTNPKTPESYKDLSALGKVDLILVTHGHNDHFGDAPALAKMHNIPVYGPAGLMQSVAALDILPAAQAMRFGKDEVHVGGEPVGYIIELENGFKIYHMGDTGLFGDMKLISDYYRPDLALMPIGGHFVMSPKDAAYATREWLKVRYVIPMHYGTTPQLKGTPAEYEAALGKARVKVMAINPGEKLHF